MHTRYPIMLTAINILDNIAGVELSASGHN